MPLTDSGRVCRQCRARKVRCDRAEPSCGSCSRLGFGCSIGRAGGDEQLQLGQTSHPSPSRSLSPQHSVTKAGFKRRRILQACQQCREQKVRCSGTGYGSTSSCKRCQQRGYPCVWRTTPEEPEHERVEVNTIINSPLLTPMRTESAGARELSSSSPGEGRGDFAVGKAAVRRYIDAYFSKANPMTCIFLHKPSVLVAWSKDELDPFLLRALCALGSQLIDDSCESPSARDAAELAARTWIYEAQAALLVGHLGQFSLVQLYSLVLIILFHFHAGEIIQAWDLIALAARRAFALQLNHEQHELDPVTQESRRRTLWAIYLLDRLFSGGIEDLTICPNERMHIRLPCDTASFERGIPSRAAHLEIGIESTKSMENPDDIHGTDVLAHYIRLSATREKILRYTKRIRRSGASPAATKDQLENLQRELDTLKNQLPEDLKLSRDQLFLKTHSADKDGYILLHTLWFQCHCDLYRFLIPGIRESVSRTAMYNTPPEFIKACQHVCLSHAIQLCDLWSATHDSIRDLGQETVNDLLLPISIYQVSQILRHLHHLLPPYPHERCLENICAKINDALDMAWRISNIPARASNCLRDVQNVLAVLGRDREKDSNGNTAMEPRDPGIEVSGSYPKEDELHNKSAWNDTISLPSRHSLIPCPVRQPEHSGIGKSAEFDSTYHISTWDEDISALRKSKSGTLSSNLDPIAGTSHLTMNGPILPVPMSLILGPNGVPYYGSSPYAFHGIDPSLLQDIPAADDEAQTSGNLGPI